MQKYLAAGTAAMAALLGAAMPPAQASDYKVGLVAAFSGAYAQWGESYKREIDLYMFQHDGKDGNPKVNLILRDAPGTDPGRTKQIVQEFITRDDVSVAGGGEFTPEALAVADLVTEAKVPYVIFNGATSFIVDKSPYLVRIGNTIWQPTVPAGKYAVEHGCKRVAMLITDYAPGQDSIDAFKAGFTPGGGVVADIIRVPLGTNDFSSYIQRIKDAKPDCVFPFMPGGPMSLNYIKSYEEAGFAKQGIVDFGTAETGENMLPAIGDAAIGMVTSWIYSPYLDNPMNKQFIAGLKAKDPDVMGKFITTFGYDGMEIIFHMLKATNGARDGDKAIASIKGYSWQSPTGPISIDPKTRDSVRNVYFRKVVKENGVIFNKEFLTIPAVKDQWHELHSGT